MAQHRYDVHPLVLRRVHVTAARDLTPRMRRVTLAGDELAAFTRDGLALPAFSTPMFDDHLKLVFASDGDLRGALPVQLAHGIDWPASDTRQGRDYTPTRFDPDAGELDLDFVLHGDGPAVTWARTAAPGDDLWFAGPKASLVLPDGVDWVLLVGDETALPAIGRFLAERPLGDLPVRAVVSIGHPDARQDLALRPGDDLRWLVADPLDADALLSAVRAVDAPAGSPYVWAAAESRVLLPLRRYVSTVLSVPKTRVTITGYWHRTAEAVDEGSTVPVLDPPDSPVAWFAVRTALAIGLLDCLAGGPVSPATAASRCEVDPSGLLPLLAVLERADVVRPTPDGRLGLGEVGELLAADEHLRERYEGVHADQVIALADLAGALHGGPSAWERRHGRSLRAAAEESPERYADLAEQADVLPFLITALPRLGLWRRGQKVACGGPGALVIADLVHQTTGAWTTVVEAPFPLRALLAPGETPHRVAQSWDGHDLAITALALGHRTDDEAVAHLRELRLATDSAVLIEVTRPDALSPAAHEDALLHLATVGAPPRSAGTIAGLAARAGWTLDARHELGWGVECLVLSARSGR
ncbi:siderophore-interacting protein [Cellulomonas sp. RIT-PI-Y]|uniref:siderophore-interacting protein n=1 Tax=Cellulomonas sp. RIT-PI-Y TaxID=3035297 RepID=UPI0021D8DB58|nr:siderophore-interacting protein [Cellulomonas sp. RIT-PI-Y]